MATPPDPDRFDRTEPGGNPSLSSSSSHPAASETQQTSAGLKYLTVKVGQVVYVDGKPRVCAEMPPSRIDDAIGALQRMKKWWKAKRQLNLLPWWQRLARRMLFLS